MEVELPSVVACTEGFSTNKLGQFNIEDIDSEDVDDPQVFSWNITNPLTCFSSVNFFLRIYVQCALFLMFCYPI